MNPTKTYSHPSSLSIFFATEMWERYGFYVVQTLLALYLTFHFKWQDKTVYELVGSFTALTYLSPIVGGWIADHLLGQKRAILVGAATLFFSYLFLSFESSGEWLTASLAGIAVGTGLLKPNISSLLGNEYPPNCPNRESGFTIFYMGITAGIILGTTLPSYLNSHYGWSSAFISSAIGLAIAILTFSFGIHRYQIKDYTPYQFQLKKVGLAIAMMLAVWWAAFYILNYPLVANSVFLTVVCLTVAYLIFCIKTDSPVHGRQTLVILGLCFISVLFWAFYFQMYLSWTLFITRVVTPELFGIHFPAPYYVSAQSFGMIIFGCILARRKKILTLKQRAGRSGNQFTLAMILMTLAYGLIVVVAKSSLSTAFISPLLILPAYLIISLAELLLSPVGLSSVTILASPNRVSTMMGIFFVSLGVGGFLSGKLAKLTAISNQVSVQTLKTHYIHSFEQVLMLLIIATGLCMAVNAGIHLLLKRGE